jgi:hypothetical protein
MGSSLPDRQFNFQMKIILVAESYAGNKQLGPQHRRQLSHRLRYDAADSVITGLAFREAVASRQSHRLAAPKWNALRTTSSP